MLYIMIETTNKNIIMLISIKYYLVTLLVFSSLYSCDRTCDPEILNDTEHKCKVFVKKRAFDNLNSSNGQKDFSFHSHNDSIVYFYLSPKDFIQIGFSVHSVKESDIYVKYLKIVCKEDSLLLDSRHSIYQEIKESSGSSCYNGGHEISLN